MPSGGSKAVHALTNNEISDKPERMPRRSTQGGYDIGLTGGGVGRTQSTRSVGDTTKGFSAIDAVVSHGANDLELVVEQVDALSARRDAPLGMQTRSGCARDAVLEEDPGIGLGLGR